MTSSWFLIHTELRYTVNHTSDLSLVIKELTFIVIVSVEFVAEQLSEAKSLQLGIER